MRPMYLLKDASHAPVIPIRLKGRSMITLFIIKLFYSLLDLGIISFLGIFLQFMKFFHVTLYFIVELFVVFVHGRLSYYRSVQMADSATKRNLGQCFKSVKRKC